MGLRKCNKTTSWAEKDIYALFETGVSLLEPEESHSSEYGYFRVFSHTHVTPPWRAISSRNQKKAEKRERKKVGYRAPAALPVPSQKHHNFI